MKIHLVRTEGVDQGLLDDVADMLRSVSGPLKIITGNDHLVELRDVGAIIDILDEERFTKMECLSSQIMESRKERSFPLSRATASWEVLFGSCNRYRKLQQIPAGDFVFLLTDVANAQNWFGALDEQHPYNGFIHTADWDYFLEVNPAYPIAYMVLSMLIQKHMFSNMEELQASLHHRAKGCINDFCQHKTEIILKLRTADICSSCYQRIIGKIDSVVFHQCMNLLERLRVKMLYSQNFRQRMPVSSMRITQQNKIILSDYQDMEINLRPLEKALYFLFLRHPEGIPLTSLIDHEQELKVLYGQLATTGMLADIHNKVRGLTDVRTNSASEKISRIRSVFENSIGEKLSRPYIIQGANSEPKKILFDRSLLYWEADHPDIHLNGREERQDGS